MKQKFYKRMVLVVFILVLSTGFVFPQGFARQAKAWFMIYSYINNFSVSAAEISYNQERDGYVCVKAYPYDPEHIDPEYPEDPYRFIDYDQPTNIYTGPMETAGQKAVDWQGRDQNGNVVAAGLYMFEAMIDSEPDCTWPAISQYAEQKEFEITAPPPPQSWSFAIITDLHVGQPPRVSDYGDDGWNDGNSGDNNNASVENLINTVNRINSDKEKYNIEFVVVDGDFTDSAELSELNKAKEILENLEVPWVPIIGNHDLWPYVSLFPGAKLPLPVSRAPEVDEQNDGADKFFNDVFDSQYEKICETFEGCESARSHIMNTVTNPIHASFFQNFAFTFNGYHFIGLDFNYRDDIFGWYWGALPRGALNDFVGGAWGWLTAHLNDYLSENPGANENIILLSHHPFRKWKEFEIRSVGIEAVQMGFTDDELTKVNDFLDDYGNKIFAQFSGHSHQNRIKDFQGIMPIIETAANVDSPLARLVQFYPDGRIDYSKMLGNDMTITAHSPIDLEVTDPDGLIINKQSDNYFEIDFDGDGDTEDQIQISDKKAGEYQIRVIPEPGAAPDSTYSLDVATLEDNFGYTPIILAQDVPVSQIPVEPYSFQPQERIVTNLSYNGDISGQYSDAINLSANLTDAGGNPIEGKEIVFKIGEQSISAVTGADGAVSASLTLNQIPGQYYSIEANFAGDLDYLPSVDINDFEILKEDTAINVLEKEGFIFEEIILEAEIKDGDGQALLPDAELEFKIDGRGLGMFKVDESGIATSSWQVDLIPEEITQNHPIEVVFAGDDYYTPVAGQANFVLKSAKWLKNEALVKLEIPAAKNLIQDSLSENLWLDASRLIFFEGDCLKKNQKDVEPEKIDPEKLFEGGKANGLARNCSWLKSGLRVFGDEFLAVKILQKKKIFQSPVIDELVKADELLAKVAIYDAENVDNTNPKFKETVERQIAKAKERLIKAQEEILKNKPDKAIANLAISWLHAQLAIKLADL